jgi:hypothetical protein
MADSLTVAVEAPCKTVQQHVGAAAAPADTARVPSLLLLLLPMPEGPPWPPWQRLHLWWHWRNSGASWWND